MGFLINFFKPGWRKMFLFLVFVFVLPTYFRVCNQACNYKLEWLAGYKLFYQQEAGILTPLMMFLLFFVSYILACLIVENYKRVFERRPGEW